MRQPSDLALAVGLLTLALPAQRTRGGDAASVWQLLAERHDTNKDGKISGDEYGRGADKFAALDRDRDGVLTAADFAGNPQGRPGAGRGQRAQPSPAQRALARLGAEADADHDGILSRAEWKAAMETRAVGRANLPSLDNLLAAYDALDTDEDGKVDVASLRAGPPAAPVLPKIGELAPDFALPTLDDPTHTVKLSSFAGSKPVALIFGSYT